MRNRRFQPSFAGSSQAGFSLIEIILVVVLIGGIVAFAATRILGGGDRAKVKVGDVIVKVDPRYYRPTEVETLLGDPTKAREKLGWTPKTMLQELVKEMVESDYTSAKRDALVKMAGFQAYDYHE